MEFIVSVSLPYYLHSNSMNAIDDRLKAPTAVSLPSSLYKATRTLFPSPPRALSRSPHSRARRRPNRSPTAQSHAISHLATAYCRCHCRSSPTRPAGFYSVHRHHQRRAQTPSKASPIPPCQAFAIAHSSPFVVVH